MESNSYIVEQSGPGSRPYAAALLASRRDLTRRVSPAQLAVLELLLTGMSEPQIALELGRSKHTIHDHTKSIYQAMHVTSRVGLVLLFTHQPALSAGTGIGTGSGTGSGSGSGTSAGRATPITPSSSGISIATEPYANLTATIIDIPPRLQATNLAGQRAERLVSA